MVSLWGWALPLGVALAVLALAGGRSGGDMAESLPTFLVPAPDAPRGAPAARAESNGNGDADLVGVLVAALEDCPNALSSVQRWKLADVINAQSEQHGYDPLFIIALVQVESGCSPTARGGEAVGLTQLLPATARGVARRAGIPWHGERTLTEPSSSIQLAVRYLDELEEQLGDPYLAVAAYNLGPARVAHMSSGRAQRTRYVRRVLLRYEQLLDQHA
jgi:soluble lytic murein transglycosylase-like protein